MQESALRQLSVPLTIGEILAPERIRTSADASSKKKTIEVLSELIAGEGGTLSPRGVAERLMARERLGSTALGHGVAIPHGRIPGAVEAVAAFVRLRDGVDFEAPDGKPVDLVVGLLVPEQCNDCHLQLLAQLAEVFSQAEVREALRTTVDPEQVWALINQAALHT